MIVKIWPIKADYGGAKGKVGGLEGVKNAVDYVSDTQKVLALQGDLLDQNPLNKIEDWIDAEEVSAINTEADIERAVSYKVNEDKTEMKYISGYRCSAEDPTVDFACAANELAALSRNKVDASTGALAFHLVQSFPENIDISDEEVHQCGLELVQKLEKYQALVCSHVHPVVNEEGEIHGKNKHNHILINAYIDPAFYDPEKGGPGKYHDCKETYWQLQMFNDEIAIEHGLPIIRWDKMERHYSWMESEERNKGTSWKARVQKDIETYRRVAEDWDDFVKIMNSEGYSVEEKKHVTYTTPNGQKVRGSTLGDPYTKEHLNMYWAVRDHARDRVKKDLELNDEPILSDFVYNYPEELSVKIPIGPQHIMDGNYVLVPLNKDTKGDDEAWRSYMSVDKLYDICDQNGNTVRAASGIEIIRSLEDLRDEGRMRYREYKRMEAEEIREERRLREEEKKKEQEKKKEKSYSDKKFRNSRSGVVYACNLYDEEGRRRGLLELIILLAITVITKESYMWSSTEGNRMPGQENEIFFAETNKKLQYLVDSLEIARQEDLNSPAELDKRLDAVGAEYSRTKKAYKDAARRVERSEPLAEAVKKYKETRQIAESIAAMPAGPEKDTLLKKYETVIQEYKTAKSFLYSSRAETDEEIAAFEERYNQFTKDAAELDVRLKDNAEHYRRLKKLQYSLQMSQDPQYVYGPSYPAERDANDTDKDGKQQETSRPLWFTLKENQERAEGQIFSGDETEKTEEVEKH